MARWVLEDVDPERVEYFSRELGIPKLAVEILLRRGFENVKSMRDFLFPSKEFVHDPLSLSDMDRAVSILMKAWREKRKVLIHGDYDVDGTTGAALLYTFMKKLGWNVEVYIPDRMNDGYGVSPSAVEEFHERGGRVLLTVDCGITAMESVRLAKNLGMEVVITDHHEVLDSLPEADAIVDPKKPGDGYPFKDLAGVGVAFKLVQALGDRFGLEFDDLREYLDLVALGTVADMVPLVDENRFYVRSGMGVIGKIKERPGVKKLLEKLMISEVKSKDISYKIAPRLNAAGRMGSAFDAFKLLVTRDEGEAEEMVEILMKHNVLRQAIETSIFNEAVSNIESEKLYELPVIIVGGENWHLGVIGIVASRIANRYGKPTLVVSFSNGVGKGSARSVNGTNILEVFQKLNTEFEEFGGHAMAVGFTISRESFERLKERIRDVDIEKREEIIKIDAEISVKDVTPELFEILEMLEPFGLGNPEPIFLIRDLEIVKTSFFDGGRSASLILRNGRRTLGAVWSSIEEDDITLMRQGALRLDVVGEIEPDFFNPKLRIKDTKFKSGVEEIDSLVTPPAHHVERKDREVELIERRVEEILWTDPWGKVVFCDIRTRNYILLEFAKRGIPILSLNDIISDHVRKSLLRHGEFGDVFFSIRDFLAELPESESVVVNEIQLLFAFREHEAVKGFLKHVSGKKLTAIGTRFVPEIKPFLKDLGFKKLRRVKPKKFSLRIQDYRFENYEPSAERFSLVISDAEGVSNVQVYSHSMNKFQRISVVNLVKRGKLKKLATEPNTDGLPVLLGGEVVYKAPPKSPYEVLDSVHPIDGSPPPVLTLNYFEGNFEFEDPLDSLYFEEFARFLYESNPRDMIRILESPEEII